MLVTADYWQQPRDQMFKCRKADADVGGMQLGCIFMLFCPGAAKLALAKAVNIASNIPQVEGFSKISVILF